MTHVGIDVGGTKCHGVLIDDHGAVLADVRHATPHADDLVGLLSSMFVELGGSSTLGIGVPGLISHEGIVRASPNLVGARNVPVGPGLREALGIPVHVENDATVAAHAEWKAGAARGADNAVMVTLGTGIGGGIVMGGVLQRGAHGFAGEIGHMVVERGGIECPCGLRGCWERYASGSALRVLSEGMTGEEVFAAYRRGDTHAGRVIDTYAEWVAVGLASLTNICDPEIIVIGGGVIESLAGTIDLVIGHFERSLYSSDLRPLPTVRPAELGERAGAIGAALLAAHSA